MDGLVFSLFLLLFEVIDMNGLKQRPLRFYPAIIIIMLEEMMRRTATMRSVYPSAVFFFSLNIFHPVLSSGARPFLSPQSRRVVGCARLSDRI